jgi:hypothetical protein
MASYYHFGIFKLSFSNSREEMKSEKGQLTNVGKNVLFFILTNVHAIVNVPIPKINDRKKTLSW